MRIRVKRTEGSLTNNLICDLADSVSDDSTVTPHDAARRVARAIDEQLTGRKLSSAQRDAVIRTVQDMLTNTIDW